jgi:hypothetical protein
MVTDASDVGCKDGCKAPFGLLRHRLGSTFACGAPGCLTANPSVSVVGLGDARL